LVFFSFYLVLSVVFLPIGGVSLDLLVLFFSFSFTHLLPQHTTGDLYGFFFLFIGFFTLLCISAISLVCFRKRKKGKKEKQEFISLF